MKTNFKKIIAIVSAVMLSLTLCSCGAGEEKNYTVEVKTEGGMPLEDIKVKVYKDKKLDDILWIAETDAEGKISFEAESSDKYTAVLEQVPSGYKAEKSYTLNGENAEVKVKPQMEKSDSLDDITYSPGDVIRDFSVTDVSGKNYQISDILKEKKAVVLNFWFLNCGPCKMEFPYLQKAYEKYSKDIEVLAINPVDGTENTISDFAKDSGLSFPMIKGESEWESCMKLSAYPTTVIIDRFGSIVMIHKGYIAEDGVFEKIFGYFVSDDYTQGIIRNISDIK